MGVTWPEVPDHKVTNRSRKRLCLCSQHGPLPTAAAELSPSPLHKSKQMRTLYFFSVSVSFKFRLIHLPQLPNDYRYKPLAHSNLELISNSSKVNMVTSRIQPQLTLDISPVPSRPVPSCPVPSLSTAPSPTPLQHRVNQAAPSTLTLWSQTGTLGSYKNTSPLHTVTYIPLISFQAPFTLAPNRRA